jgi:hypothetical protein
LRGNRKQDHAKEAEEQPSDSPTTEALHNLSKCFPGVTGTAKWNRLSAVKFSNLVMEILKKAPCSENENSLLFAESQKDSTAR